jgi:WD40 repeat protein
LHAHAGVVTSLAFKPDSKGLASASNDCKAKLWDAAARQMLLTCAGHSAQDASQERLRDNTQTPVPEQIAFRIDFPAWLDTLTARERRIAREMSNNERTLDLGRRFDLSPARIRQLRRELHDGWSRFRGETA